MAVPDKAQGHVVYIDLMEGGIEEAISQGFMKAVEGDRVLGAFVFDDVGSPEQVGDIFFDGKAGMFFDDEQIDTEGFRGELDFALELEGGEEGFEFELHSLDEGGMPEDKGCHGEPPVYI
jgi:hypothetical protein